MFDQNNKGFLNDPSDSVNHTNSIIHYVPSEINNS